MSVAKWNRIGPGLILQASLDDSKQEGPPFNNISQCSYHTLHTVIVRSPCYPKVNH